MEQKKLEDILAPVAPERKHARHSPSTLEYKEVCPLWRNIPKDEQESTGASEEGTLLHDKVEKEDLSGLNEQQRGYVQSCLDYKDGIHADLDARHGKVQIFKEIELQTPGGQHGFFDLLIIGGNEGHLIDWKFGWEAVAPAETNAQMWAYIVGAWDKFPEIEDTHLHIVLPKQGEVDTASFSRSRDYDKMRLRLETIVARCEHPDAKPNPAYEKICIRCGNKGNCDALHAHALVLSKGYAELHGENLPDLFNPAQLATPEKRAQAEILRKVLEKWCKSVGKHNLEYVLEGNEIPGFDRKVREGRRSIEVPQMAWEHVKEVLTPEEFISCTHVDITKFETVYKEKFPRGKRSKAAQELEDKLTDCGALKRGSGVPYLARTKQAIKDTEVIDI